jgi:hypothetical protein
MNPLIADNICRFTVNGTYGGRNTANILDMRVEQTGSITDREEAIKDQAKVIVSAWVDEINPRLVDDYSANSVSWLDLDSLSGSTGQTNLGTGTNMPDTGNEVGAAAPGNVALRVLRNTVAVRGQRQGRMYLAGMPETETGAGTPNTILPASVTAWNAELATFLAAINQNAGLVPPNYNSALVVVHTTVNRVNPADPSTWVLVYEGSSDVTSLTMDATVGSQRRRLRG